MQQFVTTEENKADSPEKAALQDTDKAFLQRVSALLRYAREEQGASLDEITALNNEVLQNLEDCKLEYWGQEESVQIPAFFAAVRSYAEALGLDYTQIKDECFKHDNLKKLLESEPAENTVVSAPAVSFQKPQDLTIKQPSSTPLQADRTRSREEGVIEFVPVSVLDSTSPSKEKSKRNYNAFIVLLILTVLLAVVVLSIAFDFAYLHLQSS